uniref:Uncharacterized protein n=1 Tax=virus sp. ct5rm7 TaxID=2827298 RepID=A0A8S5RG01_9VIRU|nr:MAG TPA: Protein of unknown function (DUF3185) [virus sp. ct5rm7]
MNKKVIIGLVLLIIGVMCALYGHSMENDKGYQFALALGHRGSPAPVIFMMGGVLMATTGLILILIGAFSPNGTTQPVVVVESQEERQERLNREAEQRRLREEELRRQRREKELQEEEARKRRAEFWHRHRIHIISTITVVVICIVAGCIVAHISNERNRLQAERERQEQYERQLQEKARRDEAQRQAREAERQRQLEAEEQARKEAIEAKRRQAAAAEVAKREIEERHKRGIYRVGEYYEVGDVRGVVFSTDETGQHGKILSVKQGEDISWNIASDRYAGWLLPSQEEIKVIMANKIAINKALKSAGHPIIEEKGYWLEEHWGSVVYYYGYDGQIRNCSKTDVRSQPYKKHARWVRKY